MLAMGYSDVMPLSMRAHVQVAATPPFPPFLKAFNLQLLQTQTPKP